MLSKQMQAQHDQLQAVIFWVMMRIRRVPSTTLSEISPVMASRAPKRGSPDSEPLLDPGILQNVLSYVGPGQHLFVAPVSKHWKDFYGAVEPAIGILQ
jgi:hypothetical protein